jgi:hypothetical protein
MRQTGADPGFPTGGEFRIMFRITRVCNPELCNPEFCNAQAANMAGSEFNPPQSEYNTTIISMVMRNKKQRLEVVRGVQCSYGISEFSRLPTNPTHPLTIL